MRSLVKLAEPQVLRDNGQEWTTGYVNAVKAGERPRGNWGHAEIRDRLAEETERKCAYCEGFVSHVAYEHVEHIRPKAAFPELAHDWDNLTAGCPRCNTRKGDYYVTGLELINPYDDDPEHHFIFLGNVVVHRAGSVRGELTLLRLGLRDLDVVNARLRRLEAIHAVYLRWFSSAEPLKESLASAIREDVRSGEYSAAVASFLKGLDFPLEPG